MIGLAECIGHTRNAVDYALKKPNAEKLGENWLSAENGNDVRNQFHQLTGRTVGLKKECISMVLSPDPEDGRILTNEALLAIANEFLERMGLDRHQSITVLHRDRDHKHLHIFANRKNIEGAIHNDSFIGKRAQRHADDIAKKYGMFRAKEFAREKKRATKAIRQEIYGIFEEVKREGPENFTDFQELMMDKGVEVIPTINKSNRLQGYRVEYAGHNFKASEVHRNMSLSKMGVLPKTLREGAHNPQLDLDKGRGIRR